MKGGENKESRESMKQGLRGIGYWVENHRNAWLLGVKAMFEAQSIGLWGNPPPNKLGTQIHCFT